MAGLDPRYWGNYFEQVFCKQITIFMDSIATRVLPTFDQIESEADAAVEREWERLGRIGTEDSDMGDDAERAYEAGIDYYQSLEAVRQSLINITAAALYHMFEQQVLFFHRKQLLYPEEENNIDLINMKEFEKRLNTFGVYVEKLSTWPKVEELKLVANAVKHAKGPSAHKLHSLRPDLFSRPSILKDLLFDWVDSKPDVYMPLAGKDIYLTIDDLRAYSEALVSFWSEFAKVINKPENDSPF